MSKDSDIIKIEGPNAIGGHFFEPRSEDPNVELGGNLTTNEYQGENGYISQKLGIGDLQVDQADTLEMMRATIKFCNNTEFEADPTKTTLFNLLGIIT